MQKYLTEDEIHNLMETIVKNNGKVTQHKNGNITLSNKENNIKVIWSHASGRLTNDGMKLTRLVEFN